MSRVRRNKCHGYKPTVQPTKKFQGGKEELDGNYFDRTRYGQSDRFVKTVTRIDGLVGRDNKIGGGTTRCTEAMTQTNVVITVPVRPLQGTIIYGQDSTTVSTSLLEVLRRSFMTPRFSTIRQREW